jgi:membrane associated rhomboid family serine protease
MTGTVRSIPRPLVRTNQWIIVLSVVATWLTGQEWILAIPLVAGLMGLFFGFNPIMKFAKLFLKKEPSAYIPEEWNQQQFNQAISVVCLAGGLAGYAFGWNTLGHAFTIMVAIAAFVAILGFCIGCFIRFQYIQWRAKKRIGNQH